MLDSEARILLHFLSKMRSKDLLQKVGAIMHSWKIAKHVLESFRKF